MERIVVMGGSFNPPTIAHLYLMEAALSQLPGDRGVFVPSCHAYVERKQSRLREGDRTVLPAELRTALLEALCQGNPRLSVDTRELASAKTSSHTVATLREIQAENPEAEICFIFGGDKLSGLSRWYSFEMLAREFRIILFGRNGIDLNAVIEGDPKLSLYREAFVILSQPEDAEGISATEVRERLNRGESLEGLLPDHARKLLLDWKGAQPPRILEFRDETFYLSNFYPRRVTWEGLTYLNSEAAFQSAKCLTAEERAAFCGLDPARAKRLGRQVRLRPDWEAVKDQVMLEVVRAKFTQNADLAGLLLATGDAELVEGNTWHDTYWGVDLKTMKGKNQLGQTLMRVRGELRAAAETV